MLRLFKGLALFTMGLGVSLIVGWWLAQRERTNRQAPTPVSSILTPDATSQASSLDIAPIVLPPEAFEGVEIAAPPDALESTAAPLAETHDIAAPDRPPGDFKDDLTIIKGIGPKRAEELAEIGITTFDDLATADPHQLKERLSGVAVSVDQIETWITAAKEYARS